MNYKIEFEKAAVKFIKKQPKNLQQKLLNLIDRLPQGTDIKKLKGYKDHYRLRINDYRVIYTKIDELYIIKLINIDSRGDIYK